MYYVSKVLLTGKPEQNIFQMTLKVHSFIRNNWSDKKLSKYNMIINEWTKTFALCKGGEFSFLWRMIVYFF